MGSLFFFSVLGFTLIDYQFVTNIEDFTFSAVNISKKERIVKASTRLRVLATLMPAFVERKSSIQKALSIKKVAMSERLT